MSTPQKPIVDEMRGTEAIEDPADPIFKHLRKSEIRGPNETEVSSDDEALITPSQPGGDVK